MQIIKRIYACFSCVLVIFLIFISTTKITYADSTDYGPGGTYSDWYFPDSNYESLEWTFVPLTEPPASMAEKTARQPNGVLHYYAYNFSLENSTGSIGRGYAGLQTSGIFNGQSQGKVINYSIWGSNGGNSPNAMINPNNQESGGYQIMLKYDWKIDHKYYFELKAGPSGTDASGKWWGLWVTDLGSNSVTFVGEQRVPTLINQKPAIHWSGTTSMFGEDTHWWYSINGKNQYTCSDFPKSSLAAINITANKTVKPTRVVLKTTSGETSTNNGHQSTACNVSVYADDQHNVQHNLGYWDTDAPNKLSALLNPPEPTAEPDEKKAESENNFVTTTRPTNSSSKLWIVLGGIVMIVITISGIIFYKRKKNNIQNSDDLLNNGK